jgi:hypothetical protein
MLTWQHPVRWSSAPWAYHPAATSQCFGTMVQSAWPGVCTLSLQVTAAQVLSGLIVCLVSATLAHAYQQS